MNGKIPEPLTRESIINFLSVITSIPVCQLGNETVLGGKNLVKIVISISMRFNKVINIPNPGTFTVGQLVWQLLSHQ
ncbi:hypothetical protein A2641_03485 [Candidatus Nomurabacteria bacterium RIFCSPHIGHO2_01_FULL_37_25]|uniref:Uncharacterized protein n=1 Tax=Candidatus Nomurabacteria bacterium RIFCSPLOWO2_01_FULL_36_16 TaxID=1801767 RepID=A0A1F6WZS9_9BACT|nr:MAG: hypothetical protein A2641_03485 [Candidatus Nomurabacteria bacterium RIFCSPHIGHO2_01_FULL_37_25]OGI75552.1 MAG: hypothetical protein A3D36_03130 [Candidatus Nomurabacteria bacterium RIFCSPHIGHO2_02_FULL_36_29]OGI87390.1 MAG: hypothetical protein A3A91_02750 [Candidatus Nomurabacteria bacterium RIFCSPLOWO2_01_FULL_36_16]OGI96868.1 MAG: hypothetical protein A3I84_03065 [Candidatus Nomurabacteria bacterium RIFCSPLOWO2_02_FULL_36_8]